MKTVILPNGRVARFPDDATEEEIRQATASFAPSRAAAPAAKPDGSMLPYAPLTQQNFPNAPQFDWQSQPHAYPQPASAQQLLASGAPVTQEQITGAMSTATSDQHRELQRRLYSYQNPQAPADVRLQLAEQATAGNAPSSATYWAERVPFVGGFAAASDPLAAALAARRIQDGKASPEDYLTVGQYLNDQKFYDNRSMLGQAADVITMAPALGVEMLAAAPSLGTSLGSRGAQVAAKTGGKWAAKKAISEAIESITKKSVKETAGTALKTSLKTTFGTGVGRVAKGTADRLAADPNETAVPAAAKAAVEQFINVASEQIGNFIPPTGIEKGLGEWLALTVKRSTGLNPTRANEVMRKMGVHGLLGELIEERVAEIGMGAALGEGGYGVTGAAIESFTADTPEARSAARQRAAEQLGVEFLAWAGMRAGGGAISMASQVPRRIEQAKTRNANNAYREEEARLQAEADQYAADNPLPQPSKLEQSPKSANITRQEPPTAYESQTNTAIPGRRPKREQSLVNSLKAEQSGTPGYRSSTAFLSEYPEVASALAKLPHNVSRKQFANILGTSQATLANYWGKKARSNMSEWVAEAKAVDRAIRSGVSPQAAQPKTAPLDESYGLPPQPGIQDLDPAYGKPNKGLKRDVLTYAQMQGMSGSELRRLFGGKTKNKQDIIKQEMARREAEAARRRPVAPAPVQQPPVQPPQAPVQPAPVAPQPPVQQTPVPPPAPPVQPQTPVQEDIPQRPPLSDAAQAVYKQIEGEDRDGLLSLAEMFHIKLPRKGTKALKSLTDDDLREMVAIAMTSGKGVGAQPSPPQQTPATPPPAPPAPPTPPAAATPTPPVAPAPVAATPDAPPTDADQPLDTDTINALRDIAAKHAKDAVDAMNQGASMSTAFGDGLMKAVEDVQREGGTGRHVEFVNSEFMQEWLDRGGEKFWEEDPPTDPPTDPPADPDTPPPGTPPTPTPPPAPATPTPTPPPDEPKKPDPPKSKGKKQDKPKPDKSKGKKPPEAVAKSGQPDESMQKSPRTLAELQQQITDASSGQISKDQSKALGALVDGVARYLGMSSDDYVRARFRGVVKGGEPSADALFSRRAEPSLQKKLDAEPVITVYRAMQLIDGKLYPPMSAKVDGALRNPTEIGVWEVAEERPDLVKDGKFRLDKANKSSQMAVAYNPYFHTSRSPLNDQFASASKRPNLVTVEVQIPASELTSGYRAEGAKNSVGEMAWNAGPVAGKLPKNKKRKVILSRYAKVTRIVPDAEVARKIAALLDGENITVPQNVVTPSLGKELSKLGVKVGTVTLSKTEDGVAKASVEFAADGRALIRALNATNVTDIAHELGHVFRRDLNAEDMATIEEWAGVKDGSWTREAEEKFANGFERYLANGVYPTSKLEMVFRKFEEWLSIIYGAIKGTSLDVKLTPAARQVFDRITSGDPALQSKSRHEEADQRNEGSRATFEALNRIRREIRQIVEDHAPKGQVQELDLNTLGDGWESEDADQDATSPEQERLVKAKVFGDHLAVIGPNSRRSGYSVVKLGDGPNRGDLIYHAHERAEPIMERFAQMMAIVFDFSGDGTRANNGKIPYGTQEYDYPGDAQRYGGTSSRKIADAKYALRVAAARRGYYSSDSEWEFDIEEEFNQQPKGWTPRMVFEYRSRDNARALRLLRRAITGSSGKTAPEPPASTTPVVEPKPKPEKSKGKKPEPKPELVAEEKKPEAKQPEAPPKSEFSAAGTILEGKDASQFPEVTAGTVGQVRATDAGAYILDVLQREQNAKRPAWFDGKYFHLARDGSRAPGRYSYGHRPGMGTILTQDEEPTYGDPSRKKSQMEGFDGGPTQSFNRAAVEAYEKFLIEKWAKEEVERERKEEAEAQAAERQKVISDIEQAIASNAIKGKKRQLPFVTRRRGDSSSEIEGTAYGNVGIYKDPHFRSKFVVVAIPVKEEIYYFEKRSDAVRLAQLALLLNDFSADEISKIPEDDRRGVRDGIAVIKGWANDASIEKVRKVLVPLRDMLASRVAAKASAPPAPPKKNGKKVEVAATSPVAEKTAETKAGSEQIAKDIPPPSVAEHYREQFSELLAIFDRNVDKEVNARKKMQAASHLMYDEPPAIQKALAQRLQQIAPDAVAYANSNPGSVELRLREHFKDAAIFQQREALSAEPAAERIKFVVQYAKDFANPLTEEEAEVRRAATTRYEPDLESLTRDAYPPDSWFTGRLEYQAAKGDGDAYYNNTGIATQATVQRVADRFGKRFGYKIKCVGRAEGSRLDSGFGEGRSIIAPGLDNITSTKAKDAKALQLASDIGLFFNRMKMSGVGTLPVTVDFFASDRQGIGGFAYRNHVFLNRAILFNNTLDEVWGIVGHELAHAASIDRLHQLFGEDLVARFAKDYYEIAIPEYRKLLDKNPSLLYREGVARMVQEFMSSATFRDSLLKEKPTGWAWLVELISKLFGKNEGEWKYQSPEMQKAADTFRNLLTSPEFAKAAGISAYVQFQQTPLPGPRRRREEQERARVQRAFGRANPASTVAGRSQVYEQDIASGLPENRPRSEAEAAAAARLAGDGLRKETKLFLERFRSGNFAPLPSEADYATLRGIIDNVTVAQAMGKDAKSLKDMSLLVNGWRQTRTELARSLSLRDPVARDPKTRLRRAIIHNVFEGTDSELVKKIIEALEKAGIDINSPELEENLELVAKALGIILSEKKRHAKGRVTSYFDMQYEFYVNSILSGQLTHVANISGNIFNLAWTNGVERIAEVAVSKLTRGRLTNDQQVRDMRELAAMYKAMGKAIGRAFTFAKVAWKSEYSPINLHTGHSDAFTNMMVPSYVIPGRPGKWIRMLGFRELQFFDELTRTLAAHGAAAVEAYRLGKTLGIKPGKMSDFVDGHVSDYSSPVWQAAMAEADRQTFQQEGGHMARAAKRGLDSIKKIPTVRYTIPFSSFLVNSFSRASELTPGVGLVAAAMNVLAGDKVEWNRVIASQLVASAVYATIASIADDEDENGLPRITGTKAVNSGRRGLEYMTAPPMSIRIGGVYYSYARIEPLNTMLSSAVDFSREVKRGGNAALALPASFIRQIDDKNYMQAFEDLLDVIKSDQDMSGKAFDYAGNTVVGFVPNIYRQTKREIRNELTDTTGKRGDSLETRVQRLMMKAELPGVGYAYRYDLWGKRMHTNSPKTTAIWRLLSPAKAKYTDEVLPVSIAIRRWNEQMEAQGKDDERISTELPRYPQIDGKPVSMKDYETYAREAGQYSYNALKDRKFPETMTPRHAKMIEDALKRGRKIALFRLKKRLAENE